jgi:hypothetical protein
MKSKSTRLVLGTIVIIFALSSIAFAQLMPHGQMQKTAIGIEIFKPEFNSYSVTGYMGFFDLWTGVSDKVIFMADLPYSHSNVSSEYFGRHSDDAIGNVYLGLKIMSGSTSSFCELGIRLPTAPTDRGQNALYLGALSHINRLEAFFPNLNLVASGTFGFDGTTQSGISTHFRFGPSILFFKKDYDYDKSSEFFLHYDGNLWYENKIGGIGAGISAVTIVTEENLFSENEGRNAVQLDFGANFRIGKIKPGLQFSVPLTRGLENRIDYLLSLNLFVGFD